MLEKWDLNYVVNILSSRQGELSGAQGPSCFSLVTLCLLVFQNRFMYLNNQHNFGHLVDTDNYATTHLHNDLYEIFNNPQVYNTGLQIFFKIGGPK